MDLGTSALVLVGPSDGRAREVLRLVLPTPGRCVGAAALDGGWRLAAWGDACFARRWVALGYVGGAALFLGGLALVAVDPLDARALLGAVLTLLGAGVLDRLEREPATPGG